MRYWFGVLLSMQLLGATAHADGFVQDPKVEQELRALEMTTRTTAQFRVPIPGITTAPFSYQLKWGQPKFPAPIYGDIALDSSLPTVFLRNFLDKILLEDGSYVDFGNEKLPLTCVHFDGNDNRYAGNSSPLLPNFMLKVYLVANDYSCVGPINPGFPSNGGNFETWDTYIYYEVRDPAVMIPTNIKVRYRMNEFSAILVGH